VDLPVKSIILLGGMYPRNRGNSNTAHSRLSLSPWNAGGVTRFMYSQSTKAPVEMASVTRFPGQMMWDLVIRRWGSENRSPRVAIRPANPQSVSF
jgi:hypothetical protein